MSKNSFKMLCSYTFYVYLCSEIIITIYRIIDTDMGKIELVGAIDYKDLEYIADRTIGKLKKVSPLEFSANDVLTIIRIGVLEYGSQCVENNKDFRLRRFGSFKVKDVSNSDENRDEFLKAKSTNRKQNLANRKENKEKLIAERKKVIETLDISFDSSIFVSLNNYNDKIKILNDNGNWNGNFGKCEPRPPIRQVGDVLYQDDEQRS